VEENFGNKIMIAFRDQVLTSEIVSRIHELHMIELEKLKKELLQLINKVFE
jgi:hypothetical protein